MCRVTVVVEILEEDRHLFAGDIAERAMVVLARVLKAAREVRNDVGVGGIVA
jgi:hypothetical protein